MEEKVQTMTLKKKVNQLESSNPEYQKNWSDLYQRLQDENKRLKDENAKQKKTQAELENSLSDTKKENSKILENKIDMNEIQKKREEEILQLSQQLKDAKSESVSLYGEIETIYESN